MLWHWLKLGLSSLLLDGKAKAMEERQSWRWRQKHLINDANRRQALGHCFGCIKISAKLMSGRVSE